MFPQSLTVTHATGWLTSSHASKSGRAIKHSRPPTALCTMSGIAIHTESPISPAKASGVTPQTINPSAHSTFIPTTSTTTYSDGYPSARPGASAPAATRTAYSYEPVSAPLPAPTAASIATRAIESSCVPPLPQPGAVPKPFPITAPAKSDIPPPPRMGEKAMSPEYYAPRRASPVETAQPPTYPSQMSIPSPDPAYSGQPPASVTTSFIDPFANPPASSRPVTLPQQQLTPTRTVPVSRGAYTRQSLEYPPGHMQHLYDEVDSRRSLEHPPGYVQNPYAAEMTPELRFATHFASQQTDGSPSALGYIPNKSRDNSRAGLENEEGGMWRTARKYVRRASEMVGEMEEEFWKKVSKE